MPSAGKPLPPYNPVNIHTLPVEVPQHIAARARRLAQEQPAVHDTPLIVFDDDAVQSSPPLPPPKVRPNSHGLSGLLVAPQASRTVEDSAIWNANRTLASGMPPEWTRGSPATFRGATETVPAEARRFVNDAAVSNLRRPAPAPVEPHLSVAPPMPPVPPTLRQEAAPKPAENLRPAPLKLARRPAPAPVESRVVAPAVPPMPPKVELEENVPAQTTVPVVPQLERRGADPSARKSTVSFAIGTLEPEHTSFAQTTREATEHMEPGPQAEAMHKVVGTLQRVFAKLPRGEEARQAAQQGKARTVAEWLRNVNFAGFDEDLNAVIMKPFTPSSGKLQKRGIERAFPWMSREQENALTALLARRYTYQQLDRWRNDADSLTADVANAMYPKGL